MNGSIGRGIELNEGLCKVSVQRLSDVSITIITRRSMPLILGSVTISLACCSFDAFGVEISAERLQAIEQRLKYLEEQLQKRHDISTPKTQRQKPNAEVDELNTKVHALEQHLETDKKAAVLRAKSAPVVGAGPSGFFIKSADDAFSLRLAALIQTHGSFFADTTDPTTGGAPIANRVADTFSVRRARLITQGTVYKYFDYFLNLELTGNPSVLDAFVDFRYWRPVSLRAGRFVSPIGLEHFRSAGNLSFVERGLPDNLVPDRDIGVLVYGLLGNGALEYHLGVGNGAPDRGSGAANGDNNNAKEFIGRIFSHPFENTAIPSLHGLGIGVAGTVGDQSGALPTNSAAYVTSGRQPFFTYTNGVQAAGDRYRVTPQLYYYWDSFSLLGEYVFSSQQLQRTTTLPAVSIDNDAWQVAATYLLTREKYAYKVARSPTWVNGVKPNHDFDPSNRAGKSDPGYWASGFSIHNPWGAVELIGRYSQLDVDGDAFFGGASARLADPALSARGAKAWAVGLNWYLNNFFKITANYEQTQFKGGAANGGNRPTENVGQVRFQAAF